VITFPGCELNSLPLLPQLIFRSVVLARSLSDSALERDLSRSSSGGQWGSKAAGSLPRPFICPSVGHYLPTLDQVHQENGYKLARRIDEYQVTTADLNLRRNHLLDGVARGLRRTR
jgi:hypothetical protein